MTKLDNKLFLYNKLASAIFVSTVSATSMLAFNVTAAEVKKDKPEVIEVIGIRASIQDAIRAKRDADGVMDAISASDIGKLPDNNIAEALQRVTGIQITRGNGVGSKVSVRGMSPFFTRVTINGQSATPPGNEDRASGGFGLDLLNSAMASQIQVLKSPTADMEEGGLGGTVNIVTRRGFDFAEPTGSVQLGSVFEELADENSPDASFFYANPVNEQFAFTVNVSIAEAANRRDFLDNNRWEIFDVTDDDGIEHEAFAPFRTRVRSNSLNTETSTFGGSLQYRPNEHTEFYTDLTYSKQTQDGISRDVVIDFKDANGSFKDVTIENHDNSEFGTVTSFLTDDSKKGPALKLEEKYGDSETTTLNIIQGVKWSINTDWLLEAVVSFSHGERTVINDDTKIQIDKKTKFDFGDGQGERLPVLGYSANGDVFGLIGDLSVFNNPAVWSWEQAGESYCDGKPVLCDLTDGANDFEENEEFSLQLDLSRVVNIGDIEKIKFGGRYRARSRSLEVYRDTVLIDGQEYNTRSDEVRGLVPDFNQVNQDFYGAIGGNSPFYAGYSGLEDLLWYDGSAFVDIAKVKGVNRKGEIAGFDWRETDETVIAGYVMANMAGDFGDYPYNANLGVRAVHTDIDGIGYGGLSGEEVTDINQLTALKSNNDYWDVLPSFNINIDLTDNLVFRGAIGKVMTRPEPSAASYFVQGPANAPDLEFLIEEGDEIAYEYGNPNLNPYRAWQFDAGLEYYSDNGGLVSVGLFHKDIESFIVENNILVCAEMDKEGFLPTDVIDVDGTCGITIPVDGEAEFLAVTAQQNINGKGATISGVEIGIQQPFTFLTGIWRNFGIQANYTYIDSGSDLIEESTGQELPFEGVSENSYNFVGFYDDGIFQARIAYNYRSDYLAKAYEATSLSSVSVEARGQLDASISYNVTDDFAVSLSAQNITDEARREFQGEKIRLRVYEEFGARYMLNASYKF
jgi:iron complex outermembrane receptor protein